jgi:hypothetical protein
LRESIKFQIIHEFRSHQNKSDPVAVKTLIGEAHRNLVLGDAASPNIKMFKSPCFTQSSPAPGYTDQHVVGDCVVWGGLVKVFWMNEFVHQWKAWRNWLAQYTDGRQPYMWSEVLKKNVKIKWLDLRAMFVIATTVWNESFFNPYRRIDLKVGFIIICH